MSRGTRFAVLARALGAIALFVWRHDFGAADADADPRRPAFTLPKPSPEEKSAYFFRLLGSGATWRIGEKSVPLWRVIGQAGLLGGGHRALDYLLAEERMPTYYRSTNQLLNLLSFLQEFPDAHEHPRYQPFLEYWLDPKHGPPDTPGSRPAEEFRKRIFRIFRKNPPLWAEPYCIAEITRKNRHYDLRVEALGVLLYLGRTEPILTLWDRIPPTPEEPRAQLKEFVLAQMRTFLGDDQPPARRDGARRLEPLARRALAEGDLHAQVSAASTLLRLGDESMVDRMLDLVQRAKAEGDRDVEWSALLLLAEDRADPRILKICLERVAGAVETTDFTYRTALKILAFAWIDDPVVRERIWAYVDRMGLTDLGPLQWLARAPEERARIVGLLREAIRGGPMDARLQAIRFATSASDPIGEVMPDLFDVARTTTADHGRTRYLNALVTMRFRPVVALLWADLDDDLAVLRTAAAANLLEIGEPDTVTPVGDRLEERDDAVLMPIVLRAQARGRAGVDDRLLAPLLLTLRRARGESDKFWALYALRCRGSLDGVEKGLMDAYRREPSRRVAEAIRDTLVELAHR